MAKKLYLGTGGTKRLLNDTEKTDLRADLGVVSLVSAPENSSDSGSAGQVAYDSRYFYVCVADSTWLRAPLATWS